MLKTTYRAYLQTVAEETLASLNQHENNPETIVAAYSTFANNTDNNSNNPQICVQCSPGFPLKLREPIKLTELVTVSFSQIIQTQNTFRFFKISVPTVYYDPIKHASLFYSSSV